MKLRAYLLMLFVVAVWGSTFVLIKGALVDATPAAFNLVRMTLAFAVLTAAYHRYWRGIQRWQIGAGAVVGLCLAVGYQFQTTGLARTTPSKSAFITGLVVVLVPLFSAVPGLRPVGAATAVECISWSGAGVYWNSAADCAGGCCGFGFECVARSFFDQCW
jgi:drug/metabolite transporter (DMT)-like permease